MDLTRNELIQFLTANPNGSYEQWICDIHPENATEEPLLGACEGAAIASS